MGMHLHFINQTTNYAKFVNKFLFCSPRHIQALSAPSSWDEFWSTRARRPRSPSTRMTPCWCTPIPLSTLASVSTPRREGRYLGQSGIQAPNPLDGQLVIRGGGRKHGRYFIGDRTLDMASTPTLPQVRARSTSSSLAIRPLRSSKCRNLTLFLIYSSFIHFVHISL